jgi:hypothetical protein
MRAQCCWYHDKQGSRPSLCPASRPLLDLSRSPAIISYLIISYPIISYYIILSPSASIYDLRSSTTHDLRALLLLLAAALGAVLGPVQRAVLLAAVARAPAPGAQQALHAPPAPREVAEAYMAQLAAERGAVPSPVLGAVLLTAIRGHAAQRTAPYAALRCGVQLLPALGQVADLGVLASGTSLRDEGGVGFLLCRFIRMNKYILSQIIALINYII